jgi:hypothetical protein
MAVSERESRDFSFYMRWSIPALKENNYVEVWVECCRVQARSCCTCYGCLRDEIEIRRGLKHARVMDYQACLRIADGTIMLPDPFTPRKDGVQRRPA